MSADLKQLGPYRLLRPLGQGGMAKIYLAEAFGASNFEKRVVIKVLLPELRGDATFERLLIDEALLGAQLQHRNLVQIHDLGVDRGIYYVRMDYVDGVDLGDLLARGGALGPALILYLAHEVCIALDYLHDFRDARDRPLGLVHRDVTPSNILISRSGEVKLADFGIAKATMLADVTRAKVLKGKYAYMSPEQIEGQALDPRSDQFSLGVTLYELATGTRPFEGDTPIATMDLVRAAALPSLDGVDSALQPLITRCLKRQSAERFESVETLRRAVGLAQRALAEVGPRTLGAEVIARTAIETAAKKRPETTQAD